MAKWKNVLRLVSNVTFKDWLYKYGYLASKDHLTDDMLSEALKDAQKRHGLEATGK